MKLNVYEAVKNKKDYLAVVGLGYVGLPLAVAFADKVKTIGFDVNKEKVATYRKGIDPTQEIGDEKIQQTSLKFTTDPTSLKKARVIIVAVPTPINEDKTPNLVPVISASELVGKNLAQGSIVVFESTVYPGVTEDVCVPILEKASGLKCGKDFKIAYSPERINPGDKVHRLENIKKIVSGMDKETLENVAAIYELVIEAGVYKAATIKVAEAAKLVENAQRDINIAFINELAMTFDRMGINTKDVIEAMNTKWNALGFYPGLVGGHCIGVDPYYFIYKAEILGYHSQIIAAGRKVNDGMPVFVAESIIKKMIQAKKDVNKANIYVLGATFKENCPDIRNSKAMEVVRHLATYGIKVKIVDPAVDKAEYASEYDFPLIGLKDVKNADCLIFLVAHDEFAAMGMKDIAALFRPKKAGEKNVLIDVKSMFDPKTIEGQGYSYWSL